MNLSPQSAYEEKYFLLIRVLCVMTTERFSFWQLCTLSWDPSFYTEERSTGHALRDNIFSSFIYMYIISIYLTCRAFWITKCFSSETWWMNCFNFFPENKKKIKGRMYLYRVAAINPEFFPSYFQMTQHSWKSSNLIEVKTNLHRYISRIILCIKTAH